MPLSTADGVGDAGGRRYRVKPGPWSTQTAQINLNTVDITWQTDWPTDSRLDFGRTPELGDFRESTVQVTDHLIRLTSLLPGAYWYRVQSRAPSGDGPPLALRTPLRWFIVPSYIPGDFDGDFDVDQVDFGHLQSCMSGAGNTQSNPGCLNAGLDGDDDVDANDLTLFMQCFTGADVFGDPQCAG
jgi:hypothetical protein